MVCAVSAPGAMVAREIIIRRVAGTNPYLSHFLDKGFFSEISADYRSADNRSGDKRSCDKRSGDKRSGENRSANNWILSVYINISSIKVRVGFWSFLEL